MKMFSYLTALVAMGVAFAAEVQPAAEAPADTMTMVQDARCRQVIVTCLVGGQPLRMMLDTGASHTVLHAESARKLQHVQWLDTSRMNFSGNATQRPDVLLSSLRVANLQVAQHGFLVVDLSGVRGVMAEPVDGILGMDVLGSLPFTFDLRSGKLYWGQPKGAVLVPLYGTRDEFGRLFVEVRSKEHPMQLLLDTGSSLTRVYEKDWKPGAESKRSAQVGDINSKTQLQMVVGKAADMELAPGVVLPKVRPVFCPPNDRAMLGMDALQGAVLVHLPTPGLPFGAFFVAK